MIALAWRWLAGLPRIVYVIALAVALIAGGLYSIYRYGRIVEQHTQARAVRADSVRRAVVAHRDATQHTDSTRAIAKVADSASDRGRAKRQALRAVAEPFMADWPPLAVELIHADDRQIERDSVTITAHVATDTAWIAERGAAVELDRQRARQAVELTHEPRGGSRLLWFVVGIGTAVVTAVTFVAVR